MKSGVCHAGTGGVSELEAIFRWKGQRRGGDVACSDWFEWLYVSSPLTLLVSPLPSLDPALSLIIQTP